MNEFLEYYILILMIGILLGFMWCHFLIWINKKHNLADIKVLLEDAANDTYKSYDKLKRIYKIINLAERRGLEK